MDSHSFSNHAVRLVSAMTDVTGAEMRTRTRTNRVAHARQVAIYVTRRANPRLSLPTIGKQFGLDHTTCMHAIKRVEARAACDPAFASKLGAILKEAEGLVKARTIKSVGDLPARLTTVQVCDLAGYGGVLLKKRIAAGSMPEAVDKARGYLYDRDAVLRALKLIDCEAKPEVASW